MKNKVELNKLNANYFKLPLKIHKINLSCGAIATYGYLASCGEDYYPSINTIRKALKISKNTVIKHLKELEARNIIKCFERGYIGKVSKYEFINIKEWKNDL